MSGFPQLQPKSQAASCAACGGFNRNIAKYCMNCGKFLNDRAAESPAYQLGAAVGNQRLLWISIAVVGLILVLIAIGH